MFRHIKAHGEQPGKDLCILPSGLATFTPFALRSNFVGLLVIIMIFFVSYHVV